MTETVPSRTLLGLPICEFAFPGPLRDRLVALVLAGQKTATAGLVADFVVDGDPIPRAGDRFVVVDLDRRPVAIVETTECRITTVAAVDDAFAIDEGEGFADAADWRTAHERFWGGYLDDLRRRLGDPAFDIGDSTFVVCERIRLITRLDPDTGQPIPAGLAQATQPDRGAPARRSLTWRCASRRPTAGRPPGSTRGWSGRSPSRFRPSDRERLYSAVVSTAPGDRTRIHHHGECETSIYIVSGAASYTFGPTGVEQGFDAAAGDFVYIAAGEIHVEANASATEPLVVVVTRNCPDSHVVYLDGEPDGAGDVPAPC